MSIMIHDGGLLTTIQDLGRTGYQAEGMSVAGAMDPFACQIANLLVGNTIQEPVIEMTLMGPIMEAQSDLIIVVTGADLGLKMDGKSCPLWQPILWHRGELLHFTGSKNRGAHAYLAVQGGFQLEPHFGSYATYLLGEIGGYQGRTLQKGDQLQIKKSRLDKHLLRRKMVMKWLPSYKNKKKLRVILGINQQSFTDEGIHTFLNNSYQITPHYNRMGMRLKGPSIKHRKSADIVSTTVTFGTIQVQGEGQPIILLADRQTTGGYTQIANVISVDLPLLTQSLPSETLSFEQVSVKEAQKLLIEQKHFIKQLQIHNLRN